LKGYPHYNGSAINLFWAIENMKRFKISFENLAFPSFKEDELLKCIIDLVKIEWEWMPKKPKHSLYIRPTGISMENSLGVKAAGAVKLFVIVSPVGPYYP